MSLLQWASNGWVRPHTTSPQEIGNLLAIVERDLADAEGAISADWRFGIAYNAALKLCTILLHTAGYRADRAMQHHRTLTALPLILGSAWQDDARYLDTCRVKRNTVEYDMAGAATPQDAVELTEFAGNLHVHVLAWLKKEHPELLGDAG